MKKLILLFTILVCIFFYRFINNREKPILIVGMECDYIPNNWQENKSTESNLPIENNNGFYAEGYDLQIAKLVAENAGYELKVKKFKWDELIDELLMGNIDAIFSGMLDTEERKKRVAFSEPYEIVENEYVIMVNRTSKYVNAKKFDDFRGAVITAQKDTTLDDVVEQIPGVIHAEPIVAVSDLFKHVVDKKVDGIVINYDTSQTYEGIYGKHLKTVRFPTGEGFVMGFNGTCAAVRKQDKKLLTEINDALSKISRRERQHLMDMTLVRVWKNL